MTRTKLSLTLLAAALCGCTPKPKPPREVTPIAPGSFEVSWSADTGIKAPAAVYLADNLLFIYNSKDNLVSCFDTGGSLKFRVTVGQKGDIVGQPVVSPTRIYFPTTATLETYTRDGSKIKSQALPQPMRSPAVLRGDDLFVGTDSENGGRLSDIDLNRPFNIYRWQVSTGLVNTKPVFFDGAIYAATENGRVWAINPDKTALWAIGPEMPDGLFHTDGRIIAAIKGDESGIYVASTDTKLYCLAPNTGRIRWQYYAGTPLTTSPVVTADMAYQYVDGQGLVALPKKPGERTNVPKWAFSTGKQLLADDPKYAYVLTDDHGLAAVSKADGSLAFRSRRTDLTLAVTSVDPKNPASYALAADGELVCLKPVLKPGVVGELAMLTEH